MKKKIGRFKIIRCSRRWKREQQKTEMYPRSYMVGAAAPPPGYMTKMANWPGGGVQPSPAIYTMDSQLRWAHHLDSNGQNIYAVNIPIQSIIQ